MHDNDKPDTQAGGEENSFLAALVRAAEAFAATSDEPEESNDLPPEPAKPAERSSQPASWLAA